MHKAKRAPLVHYKSTARRVWVAGALHDWNASTIVQIYPKYSMRLNMFLRNLMGFQVSG